MFHVDVSGLAAVALGGSHYVQGQRGLTGSLRPVDLHDAPPGNAADTKGQVQGKGPGGQSLHVHGDVVSQSHDGTLAVILLDL